ncbi:ATP-binding cassette domain-containing protein [Natrinema sp. 1APR25-10V2]|uniref:phosphonate ABC transporter ATP-binding protein n=1 Tax=Natrinema sp. 1APR25-10V2 TaxID=2951081 RepID=UPI0028749830|nr:ATP-binding cassette domain-containing protein [Natrinema sp. 1APR25-10V2]MDS0477285.1 ATP-binding cassette domain-containing protein [Natrinema sp. 1APR25-10V2]
MTTAERCHELRFDGLTKTFDGDVVVDDVTLSVTAGERVAVVGPSGAGKTTLLRLASGAVAPDNGTVRLDDDQLRSADVAHAYPGSTLVDRRTALANVLVGGSSSRSWWRGLLEPLAPRNPTRALELLDRVGLGEKADARADTLSAGERQRVAFARALMQDAPVIVADEPTANLDPSSSTTVLDVLDDVAGGRMSITVLHDMDLAVAHYDRIVGIVDGSVRFDRPAESTTAAELEDLSDRDEGNASARPATAHRSPRDVDAPKRIAENRYEPAQHWK